MEKIKTKEEFFDWVQRLDDQELAEQKKHFEGRDVPSHFTQSWHHGYPFGNTITYCKIKDNIFAKYEGYEIDDLNSKPIYKFTEVGKMSDQIFKDAINGILKK